MDFFDSEKVMVMGKWEDSVMLKLGCDCGHENCDMTVDMTGRALKDDPPEMRFIEINFYKTMYSTDWYSGRETFFARGWWRIKTALKMIFLGKIEMESTLMIQDQKHIESFVNAISEGLEYIKRGGK
jgi:hypothetical protein